MQLENIHKIGIFRALQLGDLLCAIPAARALRHQLPEATIILLGLPWAAQFVHRFSMYFDGLEVFPGYPGLPEQSYRPTEVVDFINRMQAKKFDLVLQMQGNGTLVNPLVELFDATYTAGFYTEESYRPANGLFMPYPSHVHEVCRHLLLLQQLGIPHQGLDLEFPLTEQDEEEAKALDLPIETGRYVCIHPGSRAAWRRWPVQAFAHMADQCIERGYDVVITGTEEERSLAETVSRSMRYEPIVTAGQTSIGALAVLIKRAKAILSNCTGVSHLASALGTPGVVISMDGEPHRWRPFNKSSLVTIDWPQTPSLGLVEELLINRLSEPLLTEQYIDCI